MMETDLVSVIVPVYNVEKYIQRCITSILNQTYKNIEVILIDDGSTDKSGKICDANKVDSRIIVIHKKNGGLSTARNCGLELARGKWITFVDSDDFIASDYVEYLLNLCKKYSVPISQCGTIRGTDDAFKTESIEVREKKWTINELYGSKERAFSVVVWGKMYSRQVIGDLRFWKGMIYEDEDFFFKVAYSAKEIVISNRHLYYYFMSDNSILRSKKTHVNFDIIQIFDDRIRYLIDFKEYQMIDITKKELCIRLMMNYCDAKKKHMDYADCKKLKKEFRKRYKGISNKKIICLKERVAIIIFYCMPDVFAFIENHFSIVKRRKLAREKK